MSGTAWEELCNALRAAGRLVLGQDVPDSPRQRAEPRTIFPASMGPTGVTGTVTYTGTDSRTPGGAGQITLVSPAKVRVPGLLAPDFVVLGTLTLSFVPEPGTLVLLGAGVAGLGALGRRRCRKAAPRT